MKQRLPQFVKPQTVTALWALVLCALVLLAAFTGRHYILSLAGVLLGVGIGGVVKIRGLTPLEALFRGPQTNGNGFQSMDLPVSMVEYIEAVDQRLAANERQMDIERAEARQMAFELQRLTEIVRSTALSETPLSLVNDIFKHCQESYAVISCELWLSEGCSDALGPVTALAEQSTPRGIPLKLVAGRGLQDDKPSLEHSRGAPVLGVVDSGHRLSACDPQSLGWLFNSSWLQQRSVQSFASFPLMIRGESVGALAVFSSAVLSEVFLGILECCSQLVALSLAKGQSFVEVSQTAANLEAANARQHEINKQLTAADRLKSEFMCTVSHELRTPLNGIIGFLGLIKDGLAKTPEEQQEFVESAYTSAEHLLALINDVLNLSEIEAGSALLTLEKISAVEAVRTAVDRFVKRAEQKGLEMRVTQTSRPDILCDRGRLDQILDNVLDNAVRFTPRGSVEVSVDEDGPMCRICIRDTGIGIDPDLQHRLFDKFQQMDGSTTRRYDGTGLGLALTRSITNMMGGTTSVESAGKNLGTTVTLRLPLAPQVLQDNTPEPDNQSPLVLVLEDDVTFGTYVCRLLNKAGYRTGLVAKSSEALDFLKDVRPSAICLDWRLGNDPQSPTSESVLKEIYTSYQSLPVVVLTGYETAVRRFLRDHALSPEPPILSKPMDSGYFLRVIQDITGANQPKAA
ncbi:MAG: hybrid sensor histidine kinase/response regulator [Armatimonadetes bacterium]|nr:hybrid sensor histidine kinase/response regulator [Armatimonadota bacterium]